MIFPDNFELKLGFDRIREMLTSNCLCNLGRQRVDAMSFSKEYENIREELLLTEDLRKILLLEDNFPQDNYLDITDCLKKIALEGSHPEVEELSDLRKSLQTIGDLSRFFNKKEIYEQYNTIARKFSPIKVLPEVNKRINQILTVEGTVRDNASRELKEIRSLVKQKQAEVHRKINSILKSARQEGIVSQEAEITLRNDRPVLPVSANFKRKIKGLIQDESATGKTVYIEPHAIVELNNQLRELEYAERREIVRILTQFANDIRPHLPEIHEVYQQLGRIDFIRAKAKLALHIHGVFTILQDSDQMHWKDAVHPLLFLSHKRDNKEVIPLNIQLNSKNRILLISGPNAGGKSVCLKTVGLLQYMLQCGLLIPMKENSETRIFEHIFVEMGDEQSLENDLSTYSSHLLSMKFFLKTSTDRTLILIDEFGTGTEPNLGGAIAESILEHLNNLGVYGVITTHYANLKHFAADHDGIVNGAMLFDTQKIRPLYTLSIGEPGSSFAIDIARSIGLPEPVLQKASEKIGEDSINMEKHLRDILRDKKYWDEKRKRIRNVEKTLDHLYHNYNQELELLRNEKKSILSQAKKEAEEILRNANKVIERTIWEIRESHADKEKTKSSRSQLEKAKSDLENLNHSVDRLGEKQQELRKAGDKLAKHSPEIEEPLIGKEKTNEIVQSKPNIGDRVRMKDFDTVGEVLGIQAKNYIVAFGSITTTLTEDKIIKVDADPQYATKKGRTTLKTHLDDRKKNFKPDIDVRGKRGDEALRMVTELIDDALLVNIKQLKILHGKGNGILRQLIRDYLKTLDEVETISDAHADSGGAGITIVMLK